jgi:hypothetical protein
MGDGRPTFVWGPWSGGGVLWFAPEPCEGGSHAAHGKELHELEEGRGLVVRTFATVGEEVGNGAGEETPGPASAQERFGDGTFEEDMLPGLDAFPAGAGDPFAEFVRFIF